jgi:hypothetical protein
VVQELQLNPQQTEGEWHHQPVGPVVDAGLNSLAIGEDVKEDASHKNACDIRYQGNRDRAHDQDDPVEERPLADQHDAGSQSKEDHEHAQATAGFYHVDGIFIQEDYVAVRQCRHATALHDKGSNHGGQSLQRS